MLSLLPDDWHSPFVLECLLPYGSKIRQTVGPTERGQAAALAELLVTLSHDLLEGQRAAALDYAAELFALLNDRDRAAAIFLTIEREDDWGGNVSPDLIDPVIALAALQQCKSRSICQGRVLHRAALVSETAAEARERLREAFALHQNQENWPDFDAMAQVASLAMEANQPDLALELAQTLDQVAQTRKGIFPSFSDIAAAEALLAADAPVAAVRAALDRAEAAMPGAEGAIVGLGGRRPITWGGSIGAEARWKQARLRARIGHVDRVIWLLDGIDQVPLAWGEVLGPDVPPAILDRLVAASARALDAAELLHLRAQTPAEMFWWNASTAHKDWALKTARVVREEVNPDADQALLTCRAIAKVAEETKDDALWTSALTCAGEAAIRSRDAAKHFDAAALWFIREAERP